MGFFSSIFGSKKRENEQAITGIGVDTAKGIKHLVERFENDSGFMMDMMQEASEGTFQLHEKDGEPTGGFEFIVRNNRIPVVGYQGIFDASSKTFYIYSLYLNKMSPYFIEVKNGEKFVCITKDAGNNQIDRTAYLYLSEREGFTIKQV
ncbi:MAG: hypothetical protein PF440_05815 [Thiomicrorhabdus sp.]|jgi:hypothetical protein|nr:hypothetical protein [Thiomicrorhabdus sp.]